MKTTRTNLFQVIAVVCLLASATGCNEAMKDTLKYDYPREENASVSGGHVLLVILDGASGRAVQVTRNARQAPTLATMAAHAIYTDYGLSDNTNAIGAGEMTNARGWANLMTGCTTHGITADEELSAIGSNHAVARLVEAGRSASIHAADDRFRAVFATEGTNAPLASSDEEAKDGALAELRGASLVPDLVVVEFKGAREAGARDGFYKADETPTDAVIAAISTLDGYIGEMMEALKARPGYANENWLVVVTSNHGGANDNGKVSSHYDDLTRNTFTMLYHDRLVPRVQGRTSDASLTYSYFTPKWSFDYQNPTPQAHAESAVIGNTTTGNMVFGEEMTIMFFVRLNTLHAGSSQNYIILSKTNKVKQSGTANGGWYICFYNSPARDFLLELGNQSSGRLCTSSVLNVAGEWYSFAITIAPDATNANMLLNAYVNGKLDSYRPNTKVSKNNFTNYTAGQVDIPLRIGGANDRTTQVSGGDTKNAVATNWFNITNLQIYDKALSAEEIELYAGKNQLHLLAGGYPLWDHLIGYWPCDLEEDEGNPVLKDYSRYRPGDGSTDFVIDRGASDQWIEGFSNDPGMHPIPETDRFYYVKTINTVDVSRQVFLWLGEAVKWEWGMEGKAWTLTYEEMVTID
ncbi:MAG: DUF4983 domain-containing protein [Odoribacteraceae bacterium]|jgi:hypothetical protein|nr:DUF4983 domain-containing protein [Odoribacteraceae bacterium]